MTDKGHPLVMGIREKRANRQLKFLSRGVIQELIDKTDFDALLEELTRQHTVNADNAEKDRRIEELEKIVAILPKTEDGVSVTPGMEYWFEYTDFPGEVGNDFASLITTDEFAEDFSKCYSTRKAAETAFAAKEPTDD